MKIVQYKKLTEYIKKNGIPSADSGTEWSGDEWQVLFKAIKEHERAQETLLPFKQFTKMFFDILPDPAFLIDKDARILKSNQLACSHLGYTASELEGEMFQKLFSDQMIFEFFRTDLIQNNYLKDIELALKASDGYLLTIIMSGIKIQIRDMDDVFLCMGSDITNLKEVEDGLRSEKKKAEQADRAKSDFLANISHEIRTPLNGIIGMNGLMLSTTLDSEQEELSEMIRVSADALLTLLNNTLDFSKIEAGKLVIEQHPFSVPDLLATISNIISYQINDKKLKFITKIDPNIADTLVGDVSRIRQVLVNLLGNAVKFTSKGSIKLSIEIDGEGKDYNELKFSVRDTGIGIPKEQQNGIFSAFIQADVSTTREYGGTGLGLSICKRLVSLMGGELNVFSRPGEGATFWFVLPLKTFSAKPLEIKLAKNHAEQDRPISEKLKILLVDDNLINQKVASRILTKEGHIVEVADNGRQAVKHFYKTKYDLILMDLQMPVMDGLSASREIRKIETDTAHQTPILALTANVLESQKYECLRAGMNGFLAKPIRLKELFAALETVRKSGSSVVTDEAFEIVLDD